MLTPKQIVDALDKYIIGQDQAKRTVAIALRNRYRRSKLSDEIKEEIIPKNIIMAGPTGVGKTEIARRLAKLVDAPFVKVEATKFTEVGYVGRDVDSMVRDLVEAAIRLVKSRWEEKVRVSAQAAAENRLADIIADAHDSELTQEHSMTGLEQLFGVVMSQKSGAGKKQQESEEQIAERISKRNMVLKDLREGKYENKMIEIEVQQPSAGNDTMLAMGIDIDLGGMLGGILPKQTKTRRTTVKEARRILEKEEADKLIDMDEVIREAIEKAEQDGIIFIDEIDKIAASGRGHGPDVSREGVQRDILPIVEGSVVNTKYGPVKTNYMLFIAAGAFSIAKITDLIPELLGRFPITVHLNALTLEDYKRILTAPENALIKQYTALLEMDNIHIEFTEDALNEMATACYLANETSENIGARRLHTIVESLLEDISFNATGDYPMLTVTIDANYVREHISTDRNENVNKYII